MVRGCCLVLCLCLAACSGQSSRAPVEDRSISGGKGVAVSSRVPRNYTVVGGDTLFSIAWRYGFDFRALARANGIAAPYTIYPGQTLQLTTAPVTTAAAPAPARSATPRKTTPKPAPSRPAKAPAAAPATAPSAIVWRWPTSGKVVRGFSGTVHKGIDIDGKEGDSVVAVAAGRVVYSGSGIVGYGKLLIVKHNEIYLSAYGHNSELLVAEGDNVTAGQRIAKKGSSATNSVKLHFEIRREGKPIDPKQLLPRR